MNNSKVLLMPLCQDCKGSSLDCCICLTCGSSSLVINTQTHRPQCPKGLEGKPNDLYDKWYRDRQAKDS